MQKWQNLYLKRKRPLTYSGEACKNVYRPFLQHHLLSNYSQNKPYFATREGQHSEERMNQVII